MQFFKVIFFLFGFFHIFRSISSPSPFQCFLMMFFLFLSVRRLSFLFPLLLPRLPLMVVVVERAVAQAAAPSVARSAAHLAAPHMAVALVVAVVPVAAVVPSLVVAHPSVVAHLSVVAHPLAVAHPSVVAHLSAVLPAVAPVVVALFKLPL